MELAKRKAPVAAAYAPPVGVPNTPGLPFRPSYAPNQLFCTPNATQATLAAPVAMPPAPPHTPDMRSISLLLEQLQAVQRVQRAQSVKPPQPGSFEPHPLWR